MKDIESERYTIVLQAPPSRVASEAELLLKLDDYSQPGLYDTEFRSLLKRMVKCTCGMIMTHRVYKEHRCVKGLFRPIKRQKLDNNQRDSGPSGEGSQGGNETSNEEDGGSN